MPNVTFSTATELAALIRDRQVSAVDVLDAHLSQIAQHNPALNAIVTLDEAGARQRAAEADAALERGELWGPLHGVPITVKDALATAGMRTTGGHEPLRDYVPEEDATAVARLKVAGAVLMGKTNLPVLSGDYQSVNPIFGRTVNPWDAGRVPGGSSGGSAAAIASGMSALELGSDYSGSIRIPAHYCGVFGLRPTEHRVPCTGHIPPLPGQPRGARHINTVGPLARSVDDLELALRIIAGPDGHEWEVPPVPLDPAPARRLDQLRVTVMDDFGGVPISVDTRRAIEQLAGELEREGCQVERVNPAGFGFDVGQAWETFGEITQAEHGSSVDPADESDVIRDFRANRDRADRMERGMARAVDADMRIYAGALVTRDHLISALDRAFERWDALICPVSVCPAIAHCDTGSPVPVDDAAVPYWPAGIAYSSPFSVVGNPVVVMPLTLSSAGLPIGVQVVGRRWGEMALFEVVRRLVDVAGGFRRPPGY